jgi:hypothetical protein
MSPSWFQRKSQEIVADQEYYPMIAGEPVTLELTASSGLPVSYRITPGYATLDGNVLTLFIPSSVTVEAIQEGNEEYLPTRKRLIYYINPVTGIEDEMIGQIAVYPNPTSDELFVKDATNEAATVTVVDMQGRVLAEKRFVGEARVDLSAVAQGVYVVCVVRGEKTVRKRVLKR